MMKNLGETQHYQPCIDIISFYTKIRFIRRRASPNGDYIRVSDTGIIQLPKPLDREFSSTYNITVAAQEILEDGKCYPLPYWTEISVQLYSRTASYQKSRATTWQPVSTKIQMKGILAGFVQQSAKSDEYLQMPRSISAQASLYSFLRFRKQRRPGPGMHCI